MQKLTMEQAMETDKPSKINPAWMRWITRRAEKNLAKWGVQDFDTLGLAVCEEAGELAQAILQHRESKHYHRIVSETIDLAALCVQMLVAVKNKNGVEAVVEILMAVNDAMATGETEEGGTQ